MTTKLTRQSRQGAFTIIELLTVMSIIVILIGLLVPALNKVRRYARTVKQKAQFHSIETALELFYNEHQAYPDSQMSDKTGAAYCGAMKLGEAMVGMDLMGFHPNSQFRRNGTMDGTPATKLYEPGAVPNLAESLKVRSLYLPPENANAYRVSDIYHQNGTPRIGPFDPCSVVLCDVYDRTPHRLTNKKLGMPILYYTADTTKKNHNILTPGDPDNIYNYTDNHELVGLGKPDDTATISVHKLFMDPDASIAPNVPGSRFYMNTRSDVVLTSINRPFRADSYILISAGFDGEYGTADDICNFEWKYRQ